MRRLITTGITASLLLVLLTGCGSSSASPSASSSVAPGATAAVTEAPIVPTSPAPTASESVNSAPPSAVRVAACPGVGVRKGPGSTEALVVRLAAGAKVRVVESVTGQAYTAGTCGTSGDQWLKIDRINGKSIKTKYGVPFGYVAAGFFQ